MIRHIFQSLLMAMLLALPVAAIAGTENKPVQSVKAERNHLREGNKHYQEKRYQQAEVEYRKALEANHQSAMAKFNLASALLREDKAEGTQKGKEQDNKKMQEAISILQQLSQAKETPTIAGKACYNLGNIAYGGQQYDQAIECYKQALRYNPADNNARYNLRLAQLKKQQQDKNKNNKDKNKDKQNKDKDKDKNKDKNKDQQQDKSNQQNKEKSKPKDQQQSGISNENAEQILRTMQNQENATQQRVNQRAARLQNGERSRTRNKW